jgi:hypothetical protein
MNKHRGKLEAIKVCRKLLQNPYAYLNANGEFDAISPWEKKYDWIEVKVRELQRAIWNNRFDLWSKGVPDDPVMLLDPTIAARVLGFDLVVEEELGKFHETSSGSKIAGIIDRVNKKLVFLDNCHIKHSNLQLPMR